MSTIQREHHSPKKKKKKKKNVFGGENGGDVKKEKRWTNSEWRDAFDRLFLDDAETFKEVGMQEIYCFTRPVFR